MAAPTINLANYKPVTSVLGTAIPGGSTAKSQYVNSLATLNLTGLGKPPVAGVTNANVLPPGFGGLNTSSGATSPVPTKITPPTTTPITPTNSAPTTYGGSVNPPATPTFSSPAAQTYINSQTNSGDVGTSAPVATPVATPVALATPAVPSAYDTALNNYLDALKSSNSLNAQAQSQTLDANHTYQTTLDKPGGLLAGNQESAALNARRDNASLADLGVAQTSATNATSEALAALEYQKGQLPTNDPYTLSPGQVRFDAQGNPIAAVPDTASAAKTIGTPATGVYQQNSDGSWTQTLAPVGGDNVQSLAQELITGNLAPSDLSKRSTGVGSYSDIITAANKLSLDQTGKPFDIAKANTDYKFANNPQTQNTLNYLGSLVGSVDGSSPGNLDQLVSLSSQVSEPKGLLGLGQTSFPALNNATQWAKLATGDPLIAAYYSTLLEVSDQVAKVLQGGGSGGTSDAKLAQAQSLFQKGFTKDQVAAVAGTLKGLLANRATSMIKDNPYLSSYAQEFGITQNNNKGSNASGNSSAGSGRLYDF